MDISPTILIFSMTVILFMIILRGKLPSFLIFCLFIFIMPHQLSIEYRGIFLVLRWTLYIGFIMSALLSGKRHNIRELLLPDILLILFIIMLIYSHSISIKPDVTFKKGISVILMYFGLFFGLYSYVTDIDDISEILKNILFFLILHNLLSLIPGIGRWHESGRFGGLSGFPTGTAAINAFVFPIAIMIYSTKRSIINLLAIFFILGIIYITYTRAAFIISILGFTLFYTQLFRKTKVLFVFIIILIIISIFISFFLLGIWLPERLVRLETLPVLGGRIEAWNMARDIITNRLFSGFGFGTEEFIYDYFGITFLKHAGKYFHNSFLGLTAQIGILNAIIFFITIIIFMFSMIYYVIDIENTHLKLIGSTLSTILFVGFMYCFVESWIYSAGNILAFIYFTVIALAIRFRQFTKGQQTTISQVK